MFAQCLQHGWVEIKVDITTYLMLKHTLRFEFLYPLDGCLAMYHDTLLYAS